MALLLLRKRSSARPFGIRTRLFSTCQWRASTQPRPTAVAVQERSTARVHTLVSTPIAVAETLPVRPLTVMRRPLLVYNMPGLQPYSIIWHLQQSIVRAKVATERRIKQAALNLSNDATHNATEYVENEVWNQERASTSLRNGSADVLLVVQHPPIYTLGRNASLKHLRFPSHVRIRVAGRGEVSHDEEHTDTLTSLELPIDYELLRVERGGEVTFHGPGQILFYPLLALNAAVSSTHELSSPAPFKPDLHWLLRSLESVVIRFLRLYDVEGERVEHASGVWVRVGKSDDAPLRKISAIGLSCTGWVSMHGCALNIDCDLKAFEWIIPCGLEADKGHSGVTSLKQMLEQRPCEHAEPIVLDHTLIREQIIQCFCAEFGISEPTAILSDLPFK